jgi:hypothetical protein
VSIVKRCREALGTVGFQWRHMTFALRNRIELYFRTLKEKKPFSNFIARKDNVKM